jgi:hypothetical protein
VTFDVAFHALIKKQNFIDMLDTVIQLPSLYYNYVNHTMNDPAAIKRRSQGLHVHLIINSFLVVLWLFVPLLKQLYTTLLDPSKSYRPVRKRIKGNTMSVWRKIYYLFHFSLCVVMTLGAIPYSKDAEAKKWLCWWSYMLTTGLFYLLAIPVPEHDGFQRTLTRFCLKYLLFIVSDCQSLSNYGYWHLGLVHDRWDYIWAHYVPHLYLLVIILVNIREYDDELNPFRQSVWYWIFTTNIASPIIVYYYYSVDVFAEYKIDMSVSSKFAVFTKLNIPLLFFFIGISRAIYRKYFDTEKKRVLLPKKPKNANFLKRNNTEERLSWQEFLQSDIPEETDSSIRQRK